MSDRPYNTLKPDARLEEQARRYEQAMGAARAARQRELAEAERKQKPKAEGQAMSGDGGDVRSEARYEWNDTDTEREQREDHRWSIGSGSEEAR